MAEKITKNEATAAEWAAADADLQRYIRQLTGGGLVLEGAAIKLIAAAGGGSMEVGRVGAVTIRLNNPLRLILREKYRSGAGEIVVRSIRLSLFDNNKAENDHAAQRLSSSLDVIEGIALHEAASDE